MNNFLRLSSLCNRPQELKEFNRSLKEFFLIMWHFYFIVFIFIFIYLLKTHKKLIYLLQFK